MGIERAPRRGNSASLGSQRSPGTWSDAGKQNLNFEGQAGVGRMANEEAPHHLALQVKVGPQHRACDFT